MTHSQTLIFLDLDDFVDELRWREFAHMRCETIREDTPNQLGTRRRYIVICTAFDADHRVVLACPVLVGTGMAQMERYEPNHENLIVAGKIVRRYLESAGFQVRPGVYAHERNGDYASASPEFWTYDKNHNLMPSDAFADLAKEEGVRT